MKSKDKPPAYPQVEFLQDIQYFNIKCRYCGVQIDSDIWNDLTKKDVDAIRAGAYRKWSCKCTNVVKIVLEHGG